VGVGVIMIYLMFRTGVPHAPESLNFKPPTNTSRD
jgi:hypothetical protein